MWSVLQSLRAKSIIVDIKTWLYREKKCNWKPVFEYDSPSGWWQLSVMSNDPVWVCHHLCRKWSNAKPRVTLFLSRIQRMESTVIRDQDIRYERRASGYLTTTFDEKQRKARVSVDVYSPSLILFGCFNAAFHHHSFIHSLIHSSLITKYRNSFHIYLPLNSETSLIAESLNVYSQQNSLTKQAFAFFKLIVRQSSSAE